jgi:menaquinone-9 beta-reductase
MLSIAPRRRRRRMSTPNECEVLIAGAGPAGLATALHLLRLRPELAGRVVALDRWRHPRPKVCAGGLIPRTMLALGELGIRLEVPSVEVRSGVARTPAGVFEIHRPDAMCTIVRRDEFDEQLARAARNVGLELIEDCAVLSIHQDAGAVEVDSAQGAFRARLVVGADGSGSRVRRAVFGERKATIGRALMADVAVDKAATPEFRDARYRFDFTCVSEGIHGYAWSFPCLIGGRPHLNLGIYDQHPAHGTGSASARPARDGARTKTPLGDALRALFPHPSLEPSRASRFKAFPIRWFDAGDRFHFGRVILAGDAAGAEPLMGEGISCAFEHGKLAARAIADALNGEADALAGYDRELRLGAMGRKLRRLGFAARRFYGPRHRLYFRLAGLSRRARELGADWYNGAAGVDDLTIAAALLRLFRAILFDTSVR